MTNLDFIKRVSERSGLTQKQIAMVLDAVEISLKELLLIEPQKIKVMDITLESKFVPEKVMMNPKTREKIISKSRGKILTNFSQDWLRIMKGE